MRILAIGGKNLASLAQEFCVDFETAPLATAGLFAISGPTGAGKSTLLDALCLALYDATPRLLKNRGSGSMLPDTGDETLYEQDPRQLLRRGAVEGFAQVDFVGTDAQRYRARWGVRRARGRPNGALQKTSMSLHRLPDLLALGGTKTEVMLEIEQRVGLSFAQFTRAVLLAQNEFSAFLKTEENERGVMLEALTGSTVYSMLSKRARERFDAEKAAMQRLMARLADQAPLAPAARADISVQCAAFDAAVGALDTRRAELEAQLRWHQEAEKLGASEASASAASAEREQLRQDAGARRALLATLDAVQPARQLVADQARLDAEVGSLHEAQAQGAQALAQASAHSAAATAALAQLADALHAAELRQHSAAPQLDQAKALDASIAALTPSHQAAHEALAASAREHALADAACQASAGELATLRAAHGGGAEWLAQQRHWEARASQWPRWDKLFEQAAQAAGSEGAAVAEAESAQAALAGAASAESGAASALGAAGELVQTLEAARQQAIAALAGYDGAGLRALQLALEARRETLAQAEKSWSALAAAHSQMQHNARLSAQLASSQEQARTALAHALAQAAPLAAAQDQAERSLKVAELACADNVAGLRATLADEQPCPVCGSLDHPYQHQDGRLHAMLAQLRAELERCRLAHQQQLAREAAERATINACAPRLAEAAAQRSVLAQQLKAAEAHWSGQPLAAGAPHQTLHADWFAGQSAGLKTESLALDAQQHAAQRAATRRDAAQGASDAAAAAHARTLETALAARAALARASALADRCAQRRTHAVAALAAPLDELDAAGLDGAQWKDDWRRDPSAFRAAREHEAQQWRAQSAQQEARTARLATLAVEQAGAATRLAQAGSAMKTAQAEFERLDGAVGGMQLARRALWEGRAAQAVEAELAGAIAAARGALAAQQALAEQAAHAQTRAREALALGQARLAACVAAAGAAQAAVTAWLQQFSARQPQTAAPADAAWLAALLAREAGWVGAERAALAALDADAARAATVLAERRAQREQHAQAGAGGDAAALGAAFEALLAERRSAHDQATALRLQLAQDDARRAGAQSTMAEIEKQQLVELRWGRLDELIGSSDGKKFRNYAQQFTLDVLLGYANHHLAQLARRYRLERIASQLGPSLGLLVRDQDMGGEIRPVNSLSGGESFLVSLALALGLASLSSNRVRVESLFIDEGFGSLDSDTLRVAMDALDGLQSLGRKVGVISHVQEMTERIATRIVVQPSAAGSSTVSVL
ncbi:MAG: AAA family ATPase [Pseudomonadota bacterium]